MFKSFLFFFFNDTSTTEIYTLSLHDALPICSRRLQKGHFAIRGSSLVSDFEARSEEHTSELQSRFDLVCRLLLEKKKLELITGIRQHYEEISILSVL